MNFKLNLPMLISIGTLPSGYLLSIPFVFLIKLLFISLRILFKILSPKINSAVSDTPCLRIAARFISNDLSAPSMACCWESNLFVQLGVILL